MSRRACYLVLLLAGACNLCKPTPPPPGNCNSDADCPAGDACLAGSCQSLTEVLQNLSAIVTPLSGDLAPQQYQNIDGTQSNLTFSLAAPQIWNFTVTLPPTCSKEEALPVTFRFTGTSIAPQIDWTFTFTTDALGNVRGALPVFEQFYEWIETATPCVAPIAKNDGTAPGLAPLPVFLPSTDTLTVVGSISTPGSPESFSGASVTVLAAQGGFAGKAISGTAITTPSPDQGPGVPTFALPMSLSAAQVPGGCPPPPVDAICDGGPCPVADDCAVFTLEVGPSASRPDLPTFDLPISGRFAIPDGGAGPILSLMGEDGMGVQLPIGPTQLVNVSGTVLQPNNDPLQSAVVTIACPSRDGGDLCPQGYGYRLTTLTGQSGSEEGAFQLQAPPNGTYTLTATPPPGLGLAPFSETVTIPDGALDGGFVAPKLQVPNGFLLSGTIFDSTGTVPITAGQVQATALASGVLVGTTEIQTSGAFGLTLPPGQYLVTVHPANSTGLPDHSQAISLQGDVSLQINLYEPARLGGGVFAESLDGGPPLPVAAASLQFFFITDTQAFGTVALPIASGITDAQGHFSVAVPSSTAPTSQ